MANTIGAYPRTGNQNDVGAYEHVGVTRSFQVIGAYTPFLTEGAGAFAIGAYNAYEVFAGGGVFPRGLSKIFFGVNPHRVASLGGELQE